MNLLALKQTFFSSDLPWLPQAVVLQWSMHAAWALVLGAAVVWLGSRLRGARPWALVVLVMLWALLPGPESPAYWLGLTFQSPSSMTVLLCLAWLVWQWRLPAGQSLAFGGQTTVSGSPTPFHSMLGAWHVAGLAGVVLGWVLLLDLLAWWPVSLYAWGFSQAALALACAVTALFWLAWGACKGGQLLVALLAGTLLLFAALRLPSGNVWDAMLDPCLWLVLQAIYLQRGHAWLRRRFKVRGATAATRA